MLALLMLWPMIGPFCVCIQAEFAVPAGSQPLGHSPGDEQAAGRASERAPELQFQCCMANMGGGLQHLPLLR